MALTRRTFVGKVMSLLFKMLSRLVITFLPRSKRLLISWLQSPSAVILEPTKINSDTVSTLFPSICHEVMGPNVMLLAFWVLSCKPLFHSPLSLSSRSFLVPLRFVPWGWYHLHIWCYWYFLPAILSPACASSSLGFCMMYSGYKLNKQGDNIQLWHTPFSSLNQSAVSCKILTVASWPAYRFLRRQVRWSGIPISKNFPVCCDRLSHSQWSRSSFLFISGIPLLCLWSSECWQFDLGSSAFSKSSLYTWKVLVFKPSLKDFWAQP